MPIGFLGLGLMGSGMAGNLLRAGHQVVVWNRSAQPARALQAQGAQVAQTPAQVGALCDVVAMCLPNGQVVEHVLFGADGVLSAAAADTVICDHSTIHPRDARALAARCRERDSWFVDAPVSGGPEGAREGTLGLFVGGDEVIVERLEPLLRAYARSIVHLGEAGAGQVGKQANQIIIAATMLGISEAFAYCGAREIPSAALLQALLGATARSVMLETRTPVPGLQPGMPASRDWQPGFSTDFMAKDLDFALDDAASAGVALSSARRVRDLLARVQDAGGGKLDWTVVATEVSRKAADNGTLPRSEQPD